MFVFVSYAQNFEDVILFRALKHIENGFYIDVGAQEESIDSVSKGFYEKGWRGVHVEPVAAFAKALRERRPDETILEIAIGTKSGKIPFFEIEGSGISTGDLGIAQGHLAQGHRVVLIEVPVKPLRSILESYSGRDIHWLKIDVEGMEQQVVESWAPSEVRPWIVVIESTRPLSSEPAHEEWEGAVASLGYDFVYFDGLNRFYVSQEHPELKEAFGPPVNPFDDFVLAPTNYHARLAVQHATEQERQSLTQRFDGERAELTQQFCSERDGLIERFEGERQELHAERQSLTGRFDEERMTLRRELEEQAARADQLTQALSASAAEVERLRPFEQALERSTAELTQLQESMKAYRIEAMEAIARGKSELTASRINLINERNERRDERVEGDRKSAQLIGRLNTLEQEAAQRAADAQRHASEAAGFKSQRDDFAAHINQQENLFKEIYSSTSWRLTSPVRAIKRGGQKLRQGPRSMVRAALERALLVHRRNPVLAARFRATAALIPPLDRRLRHFASLRMPTTHERPTASPILSPERFVALDGRPLPALMIRTRQISDELNSEFDRN